MPVSALPTVNAFLNGASAVLLVSGWLFIRSGRILAHRLCMGGALAVSAAFLASYLYYHFQVGSVRYEGPVRPLYLAILSSHTVLAVLVPPLALRALYLALKERFEEHKRAARWALPIWLYVSVTGVIVYAMLYRL